MQRQTPVASRRGQSVRDVPVPVTDGEGTSCVCESYRRNPSGGRALDGNCRIGRSSKSSTCVEVSGSSSGVAGSGSSPRRTGDINVNMVSVPSNVTSTASSVDLFSKFQRRRGDFSSDWLSLQEEVGGDRVTEPFISHELAARLRERQAGMRDGGGKASVGGNEVSGQGPRSTDKTRVSEETLRDNGSGGNDSSDISCVEKFFRERAAEYHSEKRKRSRDATIDPVTRTTPCSTSGEAGQGLSDDFLRFGSTEGEKAASPRYKVQATVAIRGGKYALASDEPPPREGALASAVPFSTGETRSVPLWCEKRFSEGKEYAKDPVIALHQEISDFVEFFQPTSSEVAMRCLVEKEITSIAKRLWPQCEPMVFGSMATGLLLPLSDIDITILNVDLPTEEALRVLASEITTSEICHAAHPQLVLKAKVPLLKFQHRGSLLDVDISINARDGARNTSIVVDRLGYYPEAKSLIVVLKYFLHQRGMDEPYHGGLGSFALTIMVISFLQHHQVYTSPPNEGYHCGLGCLLVDFFRYYGLYFRPDRCGLSIVGSGRCFRRTDVSGALVRNAASSANSLLGRGGTQSGPPQVLLEDPGCPENNAASSLRNFGIITLAFTHAYRTLTAVFNSGHGSTYCSPDAPKVDRRPTLLSRILHVDVESVKRRLALVESYTELTRNADSRLLLQQAIEEHQLKRKHMLQYGFAASKPLRTAKTVSHGRAGEDSNDSSTYGE